MNKFSKIAITLLVNISLLTLFATQVNAQTVTCSTGSYGQSTCITSSPTPTPSSEIIYRVNGTPLPVHQTVNTAIDTNILIVGTILMLLSGTGAVFFFKKSISR